MIILNCKLCPPRFGVHALEIVNRKQCPLICSCSLCFNVTRTLIFNNISTNINNNKNNNNHRGHEDVDDEDDTSKLEDGEAGCSLERGWGGRT